jgi:hypothetical protein
VTIPAGTLQQQRPGVHVWSDRTGGIGSVRSLRIEQRRNGRVAVRLRTTVLDLPGADRVGHFIEVSLRAGTSAIVATPLWHVERNSLIATQ